MGFEIKNVMGADYIPAGDNSNTIKITLDKKQKTRAALKHLIFTYFNDGKIKSVLEVDEQKQLRAFVGKEITKSKLKSLLKLFNSLSPTESRVLKDIMPFIKTVISYDQSGPNDIKYIKRVILPPFVQLYEKCRAGYDLLTQKMENQLTIKITKYDCFEIHGGSNPGDPSSERAPAKYVNDPEEKSSKIYINALDKFSAGIMTEVLYHEMMHAVGDLAVNDKNGKVYRLSDYFDAKFNGKLTRIGAKYTKRQDKAALDYTGWNILRIKTGILRKKAGKKEFDVFYKKYRETMQNPEFGCWANMEKKADTSPEEFIRNCFGDTDNAEELLARALEAYYGSDENKESLLKSDSWLYGLIRDSIDPMLKKAPVSLTGMKPAQDTNQGRMPDVLEKKHPEFEIKKVRNIKLKEIPLLGEKIDISQLGPKDREKLEKVLFDYFDNNSNFKLSALEQFALKTNFGSVITASEMDQIDKLYKESEIKNDKNLKRAMKELKSNNPKKRMAAIEKLYELYYEFAKDEKRKEITKALQYVSKNDKDAAVKEAAANRLIDIKMQEGQMY